MDYIYEPYPFSVTPEEIEKYGFIGCIRSKIEEGRRARGVDVVFDYIDRELIAQNFEKIELMCRQIIEADLPRYVALSALTITMSESKRLATIRNELAECIRKTCKDEEEIDELLHGLI
jgi:hypothetical protein